MARNKQHVGRVRKKTPAMAIYIPHIAHYVHTVRKHPESMLLSRSAIRKMPEIEIQNLIRQTLITRQKMTNSIEHASEMQHIAYEDLLQADGNPTIFVPDADFISFIHSAKFTIQGNDINLPNSQKWSYFAFPAGLRIDDIELRPCVFGYDPIQLALDEQVGQTRNDRLQLLIDCGDRYYLKATIDKESLAGAMNKGFYESMRQETLFDQYDSDTQAQINLAFRICAGICIYADTLPDSFSEGFPEGIVEKTKKALKGFTVTPVHKEGLKVIPHFRSGCIVEYTHPRYFQGEEGHVRYGERRATVVGLDVDPSKVTDKSQNGHLQESE